VEPDIADGSRDRVADASRRAFGVFCAPAFCVAAVCRLGALLRDHAETADGSHTDGRGAGGSGGYIDFPDTKE
jgi:hypothetical protein